MPFFKSRDMEQPQISNTGMCSLDEKTLQNKLCAIVQVPFFLTPPKPLPPVVLLFCSLYLDPSKLRKFFRAQHFITLQPAA